MDANDFPTLASVRKRLQAFCELNVESLFSFLFEDGISFKRDTAEATDPAKSGVRHLTSSATCIESLLRCPRYYYPRQEDPNSVRNRIEAMATKFAEAALARPAVEWKSDDSGHVYCRCRTLPLVIKHLSPGTTVAHIQAQAIKGHLKTIFKQLSGPGKGKNQRQGPWPRRFGIGEWNDKHPSDSYPPNAYHSYWSLAAIHAADKRSIPTGVTADTREAVLLWAKMKLGTEVSLHSANSPLLDSDQLAWAITIFIAFQDSLKVDLSEQDLVRQALKCLFSTQTESGAWRHYQPLFHYKNSGNAYCYNFETFATLLQVVLKRHTDGSFYLDAFRPYFRQLTQLFEYADRTRRPLPKSPGVAWNSGHRSNNTEPESWATASVYLYAQGLRRCVGIWTRSAALTDLHAVTIPDPVKSKAEILKCGRSWSKAPPSVGEQLQVLFVNPFLGIRTFDETEPDESPIGDNQSRSAILFGPPGTGKTTLARAVAGQLGWRFVELHSSHFVSEGLGGVQRVADRIFGSLMELDHAVVLFDEVDELVRGRDDQGTDQFGRFLTTSMLPRLAELWKRRKLIYFVNTNYIKYFDSAITRSQRFDALIFVAPPSFTAKRDELMRLIGKLSSGAVPTFSLSQDDVEERFSAVCRRTGVAPDGEMLLNGEELAQFKLIRWDQLPEVAELLVNDHKNWTDISADALGVALNSIHDAELKRVASYLRFAKDETYARRDFERTPVYEIDYDLSDPSVDNLIGANGKYWLRETMESIKRKYSVERLGDDGKLALRRPLPTGPKA